MQRQRNLEDESSSEMQRRTNLIDSLYLYSDLSVERIAKAAGVNVNDVQKIINNQIKKDVFEALCEQSNMPVKKLMKKDIASLDNTKQYAKSLSKKFELQCNRTF